MDQDILETDGFLLQPFHIFSSFLELYDTVFHKPEEVQIIVINQMTRTLFVLGKMVNKQ